VITDTRSTRSFAEVKKVKLEGGQGAIKEVTYQVDIKAR